MWNIDFCRSICIGASLTSMIFLCSPALGLDASLQGEALVSGFFREINSPGNSALNSAGDSYDMAAVNGRISQDDFHLGFRPEIRVLAGQSESLAPTDPAYLTVRSPSRFVNIGADLGSQGNYQGYFDFERLDLSFTPGNLEVYVGRRPISLGVLKIFPCWNKFTRPLPGVGGPVIIYGSDGAGISYQKKDVLVKQITILGSTPADQVYLGEATWYASAVELHLLASDWWQNNVLGFAFAFDAAGITFRGELLDIGVNQNVSDSQVQGGFGFERALDEKWSILGESFFQSIGVTDVADYPLEPISRFNPLRAIGYGSLNLAYQASPFWNLSAGILTNFVDLGNIIILKATNSLTDNSELFIEGDIPAAREGAEFASRSFIFSDGSAFGTPLQLQAGLKTSF
jgi:hypothetical protein